MAPQKGGWEGGMELPSTKGFVLRKSLVMVAQQIKQVRLTPCMNIIVQLLALGQHFLTSVC